MHGAVKTNIYLQLKMRSKTSCFHFWVGVAVLLCAESDEQRFPGMEGFPHRDSERIGLIASFLLPVVIASVYLVSEDLLVEKIRHAFAMEDLQVILGGRRERYLARMRKMPFPAISYHVKL